jgi:hypothetical protein
MAFRSKLRETIAQSGIRTAEISVGASRTTQVQALKPAFAASCDKCVEYSGMASGTDRASFKAAFKLRGWHHLLLPLVVVSLYHVGR